MLTIDNITLGFRGQSSPLLDSISCTFPTGTLTALTGRNGAGKSTLLREIAGLAHTRSQGEIFIDSHPLSTLDGSERSRLISVVTTERIRVPSLRCREVVAMGRAPWTGWNGSLSTADQIIIDHAIEVTGMAAYTNRRLSTLSDGECQRIMIARALAQDTPVMLLDEPTSFLDLPSRHVLADLLATVAHTQGKTIIFSTHELDLALTRCDMLALITSSPRGGSLTIYDSTTLPSLSIPDLLNLF